MRREEWCTRGTEHEVDKHSVKMRDCGLVVGGHVAERYAMEGKSSLPNVLTLRKSSVSCGGRVVYLCRMESQSAAAEKTILIPPPLFLAAGLQSTSPFWT